MHYLREIHHDKSLKKRFDTLKEKKSMFETSICMNFILPFEWGTLGGVEKMLETFSFTFPFNLARIILSGVKKFKTNFCKPPVIIINIKKYVTPFSVFSFLNQSTQTHTQSIYRERHLKRTGKHRGKSIKNKIKKSLENT